eukprot:scaffold8518_cov135-Isochrysis_galbana.AAC.6
MPPRPDTPPLPKEAPPHTQCRTTHPLYDACVRRRASDRDREQGDTRRARWRGASWGLVSVGGRP